MSDNPVMRGERKVIKQIKCGQRRNSPQVVKGHGKIVTVGQRPKGGRDIWENLSRGPASAKASGEDRTSMVGRGGGKGWREGEPTGWDPLGSSTMKGTQAGDLDQGGSRRVL